MNDTPDTDVLVTEQHGAVRVLRLNRPDARNALDPALMLALVDGLDAAEADPDTRAVVLTGTGDRAFCAGMDLRAFAASEGAGPEVLARFQRLLAGELPVPVVGAVARPFRWATSAWAAARRAIVTRNGEHET